MMNLSDVKTNHINYFGKNPFDYNKYKQPVKNEDVKRMASGFGYRTDPFTKKRRMHSNGMTSL